MLEGHGVAIGDPAFAAGADAKEVVVVAIAPDGIGITQPEGGRVSTGSEIDEQVRLEGT